MPAVTPTTRRIDRTSRGVPAVLLAATLLLGACAGPDDEGPTTASEVVGGSLAGPGTEVAPEAGAQVPPLGAADAASQDQAAARVARLTDHLDVRSAPDADAAVVRTLEATTGFGTPTVALVLEEQGDWLEVVLPGRPTGATGWVPAADVEVASVDTEVHVDLTDRELRVVADGEVVLTSAVAIGDADHPTPTGRFFVTDKLETDDPDGPYGPYAIGLSVRSEVLTEFAGGDGQIGIHGTNDPASIGRAASHGCVRVPNDVVRQLVALVPLGTPVVVS